MPFVRVLTVAVKTIFGQNRPDVTVEVDRVFGEGVMRYSKNEKEEGCDAEGIAKRAEGFGVARDGFSLNLKSGASNDLEHQVLAVREGGSAVDMQHVCWLRQKPQVGSKVI